MHRIVTAELVPSADQQHAARAATEHVVPALRTRVEARGLALTILAVIAVVFALDWAQTLVISLLLGILIAYTLNPLVVWLERIRIPRAVASMVVMLGMPSRAPSHRASRWVRLVCA
jgi:hypothetical protein